MKSHLVRAVPLFSLWISCHPPLICAQGTDHNHKVPVTYQSPTTVSIADSFAPFGARPDTDKIGDDGSAAVRDRNGVIIWTDSMNNASVLPNSSLAKSLYVSNTECVVWNNRYARDYNVWGSVSDIIIYRRNPDNTIVAAPKITVRGTLLDTSSVTPTSFGFTIVAAYGWNERTDESLVVTWTKKTTPGTGTPPGPATTEYNTTSAQVDQWHNINYEMYRITWDAVVQFLNFSTVDVPKTNTNLGGTVVLGHGDDGSFAFNTVAAGSYVEDRGSIDPDAPPPIPRSFSTTFQSLWATWQINSEDIHSVDFGDSFPEAAYVSNSRLLLQSEIIDFIEFPPGSGNFYRDSHRGLQDLGLPDEFERTFELGG